MQQGVSVLTVITIPGRTMIPVVLGDTNEQPLLPGGSGSRSSGGYSIQYTRQENLLTAAPPSSHAWEDKQN